MNISDDSDLDFNPKDCVVLSMPEFGIDIGKFMSENQHDQARFLEGKYDVIINVSDSPCLSFDIQGPKSYWFPIYEYSTWSKESLFAVMSALDKFVSFGLNIYVHCHGGKVRSRSVVALWLHTRKDIKKGMAALKVGLSQDEFDETVKKHVPEETLGLLRKISEGKSILDVSQPVICGLDDGPCESCQ